MIFEFTIRQIKRFKRLILLFASGMVILVFLTFLTTAPDRAPQKSESIKGVWLTHVGNAFLTYASLTDNVFYQLSRLNYNRVYVDVYNGGTAYSSKYAPRNYLVALPFTNPLKKAIKEGKRQGLKVYAWYEHGMMTFANARLAQEHPDWILTTDNGEKLIDNHWWLDPNTVRISLIFLSPCSPCSPCLSQHITLLTEQYCCLPCFPLPPLLPLLPLLPSTHNFVNRTVLG
ncbi:MAG: family 10 glycosylhydrolase [Pleurocapsa sp. MO_226.B13]|nr:family 10 glycosylhydrolase [Pleurocapsa sp. MO_226.B13]